MLVTTVVAGGIAILRPFQAASRPFLRDVSFYMVAVFLTFTACYRGRVTLFWALGEAQGRWGAGSGERQEGPRSLRFWGSAWEASTSSLGLWPQGG